MSESSLPVTVDAELRSFSDDVARSATEFLANLRNTITQANQAEAISLLLLQVAQISFVGARLGAHVDVSPVQEFQPDVGPDPEVDDWRRQLADLLGEGDEYSFVFDPYNPEVVQSLLSDDLISIATDLENGLRHYRAGDVAEALWWWQFSYVSSWGNLAGAALNALITIVTRDRLASEIGDDAVYAQAAVDEILDGDAVTPR